MVHVASELPSNIDWSYLQGTTWSATVTIPSHLTDGTPSLATFVDRIYTVHAATNTTIHSLESLDRHAPCF